MKRPTSAPAEDRSGAGAPFAGGTLEDTVATTGQPSPVAAEGGYRGPQVCRLVGITYRQLDYWARTDLLRPSISEARGSGSQRLYSYRDLLHLKVIKRLLDAGISLHQARRAVDCLRSSGDDIAAANLVIEEGRSVLAHSDGEIVDLLRGGQGVLNIVPLGSVVDELATAVTELSDAPTRQARAAAGTSSAPAAAARAAAPAGSEPPVDGVAPARVQTARRAQGA